MATAHPISIAFAAALQEKSERRVALDKLNDKPHSQYATSYVYWVESGQKFDKIVHRLGKMGQSSVHAFIEKSTGKLIKAATWKAPQKDKNGLAYRYDLSTPEGFAHAAYNADDYGRYLYADYTPVDDPKWLDTLPKAVPAEPVVSKRLAITFDLLDVPQDDREPLTWGKVRDLINHYTPAAVDLEVSKGLSYDASYNLVWGTFEVAVETV